MLNRIFDIFWEEHAQITKKFEALENPEKSVGLDFQFDLKNILTRFYMLLTKLNQALPLYSKQREILENISQKPINLISGATGCGKTILLPQIIWEHFLDDKKWAQCQRIFVVLKSTIDMTVMASRSNN